MWYDRYKTITDYDQSSVSWTLLLIFNILFYILYNYSFSHSYQIYELEVLS